MINVRLYARASTAEQHADRAVPALESFVNERGWSIAARYIENASGARLERPELMRLLDDAEAGDVLLIESWPPASESWLLPVDMLDAV